MKYDIESKLNTVRTQIDLVAMTEAEKHTMWQKIEMGMNKKAFHFFGFIRTRVRATIAFVLVILFAGSSVAFAYADTAQPGDILFPLGVAREKVQIFLAPASQKNDLRIKFAEKRIEDGQVFLSLLVKAHGTYAASFASTTATTTATATATATSTTATTTPNNATQDATRHFNATIAYLQGIQAELLKNGDVAASSALQNAIDAMIAEAHQAPPFSGNDSVLVKIKDNADKFKFDIRIAHSTTTIRIASEGKNKERGHGKNDDDDNDSRSQIVPSATTSPTATPVITDNFISRFFHKEEKHHEHEQENEHKDRNKDENEEDDNGGEHEGFFDRFLGKATICHISGGQSQTISVGKSAVPAHLAHGDHLGVCDTSPAPDTTAPVISSIVSHPTATTAEVAWGTDERASYKFWYGTTTPLALAGTPDKTGGANTHQSAALSGLSSDTTYYYVIVATDASGNTSTSTQQSFKTTVIPDTTAPAISNLSATAITPESATISWSTNESSTGKVKYGTTTPLINILESTALSLSHSFNLTGLVASSTYHYVVFSTDAAGNTANSAELTFTTD